MALLVLLLIAGAASEEPFPRVVRKGDLTCIQSLDVKGAVVEQCRKEGATEYEVRYPRSVKKGDPVCTQTLELQGRAGAGD